MQLRRLTVLILSTGIFCSDACKDIGNAEIGIPPVGSVRATYSYKGYNADGSLMVADTMILALSADSSVTGTWTFDAVSSTDKAGPQVGSGKLVGTKQSATISINLNPG